MEQKLIQLYKQKILALLLKKYERSQSFQAGIPSKQRPQVAFKGSELAQDYYDEMDYRKREWIHNALLELSQERVVEISWLKHKENIEVGKVYLNYAGVERAYQLSGKKPKGDKIKQLAEVLPPLMEHPWEWVRAWGEDTYLKLQARKPSGLELDDLEGYQDLVQVLLTLPKLEENTPKRIMSQRLFQDSKHFEQVVERRLLSLLRKIYPEELDKDDDYLDQVGIIENPKLTLVCGSLEVATKSAVESTDEILRVTAERGGTGKLNLGIFPGGLGLSAAAIREISILGIPARTILLIENLTTYYEVIQSPVVLPSPQLIIYTGGFPHKSTQKLLRKIAAFLETNPSSLDPITIYHWGDMDYGGIRIFEYIKESFFPALKPYQMDVKTYLNYVEKGLPFGGEQKTKLERLLNEPKYEAWYPVIKVLLEHGKRVEQESIRF